MNKDKLKAFTLIEITIAMLIAAVVIGLCYYTFQLFMNLSHEQQQKKNEQFQAELLQHLLVRDFDHARAIYLEDERLTIQDSSGEIKYTLSANHILRNQYDLRTDTFQMKVLEHKAEFEGPKLPDPNLINRLSLQLQQEKQTWSQSLSKNYTAQQLMRIENLQYSFN
ncbi:type II secretion system protein [Sphingobacterium spiritivorum]|uniref:type II secretion system protein n=1 Tax=Sphingobacterium spiritivorum TaxID=258 RepID=UPI00191A3ED9|nr:type II secretion system protein [Sphingobacterium spiritivorum]QQT24848.1 type II secretion system protein [Sphingobacterium spiritivorum]